MQRQISKCRFWRLKKKEWEDDILAVFKCIWWCYKANSFSYKVTNVVKWVCLHSTIAMAPLDFFSYNLIINLVFLAITVPLQQPNQMAKKIQRMKMIACTVIKYHLKFCVKDDLNLTEKLI